MVLNLIATFAILLLLAAIAIAVLKRRSPGHLAHRFGPEHERIRRPGAGARRPSAPRGQAR